MVVKGLARGVYVYVNGYTYTPHRASYCLVSFLVNLLRQGAVG